MEETKLINMFIFADTLSLSVLANCIIYKNSPVAKYELKNGIVLNLNTREHFTLVLQWL